jgi:uncharacterized protein (TIGR02217 family)
MTFRNVRFVTGIRYGSTAGPSYSTQIARSISGSTQRQKNWIFPLRRWQVDRALRDTTLRAEFLSFFHNMNGAGDTFRMRDPGDYTVSASEGVFTAITSNTFQMCKRYTTGSYTKDLPIYLPVLNTITITGLTAGVHYSIDYTVPSGVVTMLGSPTSTPTSWSGEYDIHARLEKDELPLNIEDEDLYFANAVTIIEERSLV